MNNKKTTKATIEINGIDRSTPDNVVKDGCCSELHNLRYHAGAWRSVNQPKEIHRIIKGESELHIIYKHPASADNRYIAQDGAGNFIEIEVQDEGAYEVTYTFSEAKGCQKVAHFGNVLLFYAGDKAKYYIITNGIYSIYGKPDGRCLDISLVNNPNCNLYLNTHSLNPDKMEVKTLGVISLDSDNGDITTKGIYGLPIANEEGPLGFRTGYEDGYWHGEIICFAEIYDKNGSPIERTLPVFVTSGTSPGNMIDYYNYGDHYAYERNIKAVEILHKAGDPLDQAKLEATHKFNFVSRCKPIVRLFVYNSARLKDVEYVRIYSTRVLPIFDFGKLKNTLFNAAGTPTILDFTEFFKYNDFASEPFYMAKEVNISEFEDYEWTEDGYTDGENIDYHSEDDVKVYRFDLSWTDILENIEAKGSVYEPTINNIIGFDGYIEYNNRAHFWGASEQLAFNEPEGLPGSLLNVRIKVEGGEELVEYRMYTGVSTQDTLEKNRYLNTYKSQDNILLAYPDARAFALEGLGSMIQHYATNFALFIKKDETFELDPEVDKILTGELSTLIYPGRLRWLKYTTPPVEGCTFFGGDSIIIRNHNKIQASEPGSPLHLLFDKSYQIGSKSNRILAINSVAMEISDNKTGEFPLFAFTEEGIFALHLSDQFLYNPIAAVNFDRVINENTVAANGVVAYFTEEGLHLISQQSNNLISLPLNNNRGSSFIGSGEALYWSRKHNELIMMSRDGEVFAYSLEHGYWSTRRITAEQAQCSRLNNDMVAIESEGAISILSTQEEHDLEEPIRILLETRPIKLGSMEYKRIETLIVRMASDPYNVPVKISVFGSNDTTNWMLLRSGEIETGSDIRIRHMLGSSRLIKIRLEAMIGQECQLSLLGFIAEYFHRFVSKVR